MESKIIIVTGISGSGSKNFCEKYEPEGKKSKIYSTGNLIYRLAQEGIGEETQIPKENLLNLHPYILSNLRDKAFETIISNLKEDKEKYDRIFIDMHAEFFWNHVYQNAYAWKYLNKIPADMFVTIIDKPSAIKANQMKTPLGKSQNHNLRDILLWQNVEINVTNGWASNYAKPMYVFSNKQNPETIDSLLENSFLIYSSFPMTDADKEATEKINNFKKRLRSCKKEIDGKETPVIDPADIDIEKDYEISENEKEAIYAQTVHRDLNWDIGQSTHVVAYYPNDKTELSKGVSDECTRARETGKFVYVICPRTHQSPFMGIAHKVFKDEEEFFSFFKEHMKNILEVFKRKNPKDICWQF